MRLLRQFQDKMQAVILAAGEGTRMLPLTETRPKPLLKIANKTILEHNLDQLSDLVNEVIIVVGYKREMIEDLVGDRYGDLDIKYICQEEPKGTGDALRAAEKLLKDKFFVLCGDNLYFKRDLKNMLRFDQCILLKESKTPEEFGVVVTENNVVVELEEKPEKPKTNLVNTGGYILNKNIFNFKIEKSVRGEYELTDYIKKIIPELRFVIGENWFSLTYPWDLLEANEFFLRNMERKIEADVEGSYIGENVQVGQGTIIKRGSYIENNVIIGKNCRIGPNCYIRGSTSIGDGCHIGNGVEIKNSIFYDNSNAPHLNYVGDTIVGSNCNLGAGTIIANLRHDNKNVFVNIKNALVDTRRRKFGAVLGDNVKTGVGTLIYPGRKIWTNRTTRPGEIVNKDIV